MKNREKNSSKHEKTLERSKNSSTKTVLVEIEKNFFIETTEHNKVRLEKWRIGRRNFS